MTAPTHIFASVVYLLLAALMLRCLDLSWPYIAFTVLSGLISDTLLLTSPTTTKRDHLAGERLARAGPWALAPLRIASAGRRRMKC